MHATPARPSRIALVGAHETGKSTLAERLATTMPGWHVVDEPYRTLEAEGHVFSDPPTTSDFEAQLRRSMADVESAEPAVIFDRSPVDLFAYLLVLDRLPPDAVAAWFREVHEATASIDLVVFVPIEQPDRVLGASAPRLRRRVDRLLRAGLVEGEWGLAAPVLEVDGSPEDRVEQIRARLAAGAP